MSEASLSSRPYNHYRIIGASETEQGDVKFSIPYDALTEAETLARTDSSWEDLDHLGIKLCVVEEGFVVSESIAKVLRGDKSALLSGLAEMSVPVS